MPARPPSRSRSPSPLPTARQGVLIGRGPPFRAETVTRLFFRSMLIVDSANGPARKRHPLSWLTWAGMSSWLTRFRSAAEISGVRRAVGCSRTAACYLPHTPQKLLVRRHGQDVAAFVFDVAAVATDVSEADADAAEQFVQLPPEFFVLDLGPVAVLAAPPVVLFPFRHPFRHALAHVGAVGHQFDGGGPFEGFQAADDGHQLHAVVGRLAFAAEGFFLFLRGGVAQDEGPPARTGIAAARAVGEQSDFRETLLGGLGIG